MTPPVRLTAPEQAAFPRARSWRKTGGVALALVLAAGVRLWIWGDVFGVGGFRITGDDDAVYHVLRTERMIAGAPGAPWRDPALDYPYGANVPWPPLFDGLLAAAGVVTAGGTTPDRVQLETGASFVPVLLGLATILLVVPLARLLAGAGALEAAILLALLPGHATFTMLGRTDHHAAELLLCTASFLALACGLRDPARHRRAGPALLGLSLTLSFWNWSGSALYPLVLVMFTALWTIAAPPDDASARRVTRDLAAGCGLASALLAATIAMARGPSALADMSLTGLSGAHPLFLAATAGFAAMLLVTRARSVLVATLPQRAIAVLAAAAIAAAMVLAVPGSWRAIAHGLTVVARANTFFEGVQELTPVLFGGWEPLTAELRHVVSFWGLTLAFVPFALVVLARRMRADGARAPVAFLLLWMAIFLAFAMARRRFALYLSAPLAICAGAGVNALAWWVTGRLPRLRSSLVRGVATAVTIGVLVGPALLLLEENVGGEDADHRELRALLEALRDAPTPPGRPAVLTHWAFGHLVQYAAGRPVVASPFGTDLGDRSMADSAAFFLATDEAEAEEILARRGAGIVIVADPISEIAVAQGFAPERPALVHLRPTWSSGMQVDLAPGFRDVVAVRLFSWRRGPGAPGGFRLLNESRLGPRGVPMFRAFGVVPGVHMIVAGARPGAPVRATTRLATHHGRVLEWVTFGDADVAGRATLRLPYATGLNGRIVAEPYVISDGESNVVVEVPEALVIGGDGAFVSLSGDPSPQ